MSGRRSLLPLAVAIPHASQGQVYLKVVWTTGQAKFHSSTILSPVHKTFPF